jgi:anti-sigma B factor antagonist
LQQGDFPPRLFSGRRETAAGRTIPARCRPLAAGFFPGVNSPVFLTLAKGKLAGGEAPEDPVNFSATVRENGPISVVYVTGSLTSFEVAGLRSTISGLVKQGRRKIVLNLDGLRYLDSSGIGELVRNYMTVIKSGGEMKVVGLKSKVEEIFKVTQLHQIFEEFRDEAHALESFPENRKIAAPPAREPENQAEKERSS